MINRAYQEGENLVYKIGEKIAAKKSAEIDIPWLIEQLQQKTFDLYGQSLSEITFKLTASSDRTEHNYAPCEARTKKHYVCINPTDDCPCSCHTLIRDHKEQKGEEKHDRGFCECTDGNCGPMPHSCWCKCHKGERCDVCSGRFTGFGTNGEVVNLCNGHLETVGKWTILHPVPQEEHDYYVCNAKCDGTRPRFMQGTKPYACPCKCHSAPDKP